MASSTSQHCIPAQGLVLAACDCLLSRLMAGGNPYTQFPEGQKWHNWSWWQYPASGAFVKCEQSGDLILVICDLASLL